MKIIPAIDIKDGNVVRLTKGDYKSIEVYSDDPANIARRWHSQGASMLHVVDLDGALAGEPKNLDSVAAIVMAVDIPVQLGGGLHSLSAIEQAFTIGVAKVVLGTKAIEDIEFIKDVIKKYRDKIAVAIDSKDGIVMLKGWTKSSGMDATDMAKRIEALGVSTIIYTDVAVDGTLSGPNLERVSNFLNSVNLSVVIAGGVASIDDIRRLRALKLNKNNLIGVIVGKALYEGRVNLKEAIRVCLRRE